METAIASHPPPPAYSFSCTLDFEHLYTSQLHLISMSQDGAHEKRLNMEQGDLGSDLGSVDLGSASGSAVGL